MATLEDAESRRSSLMRHLTSTQSSSDCADISAATNDHWNREGRHHRSASSLSSCRLQLQKDEAPEVVNLRRLIAEQNATLGEQRRRIEATERQIDDYERRIHDDRCEQDGDDYLQRAYNLSPYDTNNEYDHFVNRYRQIATEDEIAVCYRQASNEIRQRLVDVKVQLVDICQRIASVACDNGKNPRRLDGFDRSACRNVDQEAQMVVDGNGQRRRGFQLDALRLELARADDMRHQQLVEHRRLSSAVEDAQSQLSDEEVRLVAVLAACDESSTSSNSRKLFQPLKVKSNKFQKDERQRRPEKDLQISRRSDAAGQVSNVSDVTSSTLSTVTTRLSGSGKSRNDDMYITSKSREIYTYSDTSASGSAAVDARCSSIPGNDDLFADCRRLVTLV